MCAENGSCYGDISAITGRPKTINVGAYVRKDGTFVRERNARDRHMEEVQRQGLERENDKAVKH